MKETKRKGVGPWKVVRLLGGPRAHEELEEEEHITSIPTLEPLGVYKAIEERWEDGMECFRWEDCRL